MIHILSRIALLVPCVTLAVSCATTTPPPLQPFESDGCSGIQDGPDEQPDKWTDFCYLHDISYWHGGTFRDRLEADRDLRDAIKEAGNPLSASVVFAGVRLGGSPLWPTPWRWGFGWKAYPRWYRSLTPEEQRVVNEASPASKERTSSE